MMMHGLANFKYIENVPFVGLYGITTF